VWADITLTDAQLRDPATVARLLPSLRLAGHSLKRLNIKCFGGTPTVASVRSILEVAVPGLEALTLLGPSYDELFMRSARDALASASRLTYLSIENTTIVAPCRLPGRAWAAAATDEFLGCGYLRHHVRQAAVIAAAAAPAGARLAKITGAHAWYRNEVEAFGALTAVSGAGLTHLSTFVFAAQLPALAAVVARLPALVELAVGDDMFAHAVRVLDLTTLTSPSLERLAVVYKDMGSVRVSDATAARLGELVLLCGLAWPGPPDIFRGGGGGRFTRLTRLEYEPSSSDCVNLGPWSDAEFSIPTLVELSVRGWAFTLGRRDGRAWAASVARETLPRLARLELLFSDASGRFLKYACRGGTEDRRDARDDRPVCLSCRAVGGCPAGREAERALWEALPAAAAAAGRQLVVSDRRRTAAWWPGTFHRFTLRFEATPPGG
jgi:hypothetical protein